MKILPIPEICAAVDDLSGARCTLEHKHDLPHADRSVDGCEIHFKDSTQLIVPYSGTAMNSVPFPAPNHDNMGTYYG